MKESEKMVLNEFNTKETLDLNASTEKAAEGISDAAKRKKKLMITLISTLAVVVSVAAITAVVLHLNDPNSYDRGESKFVTDSDSVSVETLDNSVIGMGVLYESAVVYDSTSDNAAVITTLTQGTSVMIYDVSGDYYKVSNSQKTVSGYVHRDSVNTGGIEIGGATPVKVDESSNKDSSAKKKSTTAKTTTTSTVNPEDFPVNSSPYFIYVEKGSHTITIYTKDSSGKYTVPSATYSTATGRTSGLTPVGNFSILAKEAWHTWGSTSYSPYCTKYYGNLYFHGAIYTKKGDFSSLNEGSVYDIGKNTTSGCMRTSAAAAYAIYNCPVGTNVKIVNGSPLKRSASRPSVESQYIDPAGKTVAVKGISFENTKKTIKVDESFTAKVIFEPTDATNVRCTWASSDSKVAEMEVADDGASCTLKGLKAGSTIITAISADGNYKAQFTLTVKAETTTTKTTKATTESTTEETRATTEATESTESTTTEPTESTTKKTEAPSEPTPEEPESPNTDEN